MDFKCNKCKNQSFKLITDGLRSISEKECGGIMYQEDYDDYKYFTEDEENFFECTSCYQKYEAIRMTDDNGNAYYQRAEYVIEENIEKNVIYTLTERVDTDAYVVAVSKSLKTIEQKLLERKEVLKEEMKESSEDEIEEFITEEGSFCSLSSLRTTIELSIQEMKLI